MFRPRVIPCLLLQNLGLVKTVNFKNPRYIGDPINAVRIFNDLKADELVFLDISATKNKTKPNFNLIAKIGDQCNMPFAVGGGVRNIEDAKNIVNAGAEKIVVNSIAYENPDFVSLLADKFGSQSVVVSIDVKKKLLGKYEVVIQNGTKSTGFSPVDYAKLMESKGAGEVMLTSVNNEGLMKGFDNKLIKEVSENISIPLIANGGAGNVNHLAEAINLGKASAVSAGSIFVYHGPMNGILINFPTNSELKALFQIV
jgi:cyclase